MHISLDSLEEALSIRRQVDTLEKRLSTLLRGSPLTAVSTHSGNRRMSAQARAKIAGRNASTVGKDKGKDNCSEDCKEKGRTHRCWKKETFATYEGSVGSKKKSCRWQKITYGLRPLRVYRPAIDCLNLSKAGWSWDCVSGRGYRGRT